MIAGALGLSRDRTGAGTGGVGGGGNGGYVRPEIKIEVSVSLVHVGGSEGELEDVDASKRIVSLIRIRWFVCVYRGSCLGKSSMIRLSGSGRRTGGLRLSIR